MKPKLNNKTSNRSDSECIFCAASAEMTRSYECVTADRDTLEFETRKPHQFLPHFTLTTIKEQRQISSVIVFGLSGPDGATQRNARLIEFCMLRAPIMAIALTQSTKAKVIGEESEKEWPGGERVCESRDRVTQATAQQAIGCGLTSLRRCIEVSVNVPVVCATIDRW